jgi:predicted dehydrogenase
MAMPTPASSRRTFLRSAASTVAVFGLPSVNVLGANEKINLGIIGFRGRGRDNMRLAAEHPHARIAALCDVDADILGKEVKAREGKGEKIFATQDLRRVMEQKDIDGVMISTPNHWHALAGIWAVQAGKHAYIEKPISHSIWEGRQLANLARKSGLMVQTGTQNRSDDGLLAFKEWWKSNSLGKIQWVHAFWYNARANIGRAKGEQPIPANIDYDLWCGPGPKGPLHRKQLHYDWHWTWAYGNGEMGNVGPHVIDDARWLCDLGLPRTALSAGARVLWDDDGETPNMHVCVFDYGDFPLIGEVRSVPRKPPTEKSDAWSRRNAKSTVIIQCENGSWVGSRGGGWVYDQDGKKVKGFPGDGGRMHQANWLDAIRANDAKLLRSDAEAGHLSASLCHMACISHLAGKTESMDVIRDKMKAVPAAGEVFGTVEDHLKSCGADLTATPYTLGAYLEYDAKAERFAKGVNLDKANSLLKDTYRAPFVVPYVSA